MPLYLSRDLDEKIRQCEIAGIRSGIETARRLQPETGAATIDVADGLVAFTGIDSPLSQAYGVGVVAPVSGADLDRITDFYESRGAVARVFVTPLSDASFGRALARAGYAPCEYENVLASDSFEFGQRNERIDAARDLDAWSLASARAFTDLGSIGARDLAIARIIAHSDVWALEAREDDEAIATAAMDLRGDCAAFFAGSVLPAFRGRGWHRAMVRDRVARARDAGARLMRATAKPGSISERNFHRCGFVTLYTRALWERK